MILLMSDIPQIDHAVSELVCDPDADLLHRFLPKQKKGEVANWFSWISDSCSTSIEAAMGMALCLEFLPEIKAVGFTRDVIHPQFRTSRLSPELRFILDFMVTVDGKRIGVECDGKDYHSTLEQRSRDAFRTKLIHKASGLFIIRVTGAEIFADPLKCAAMVRDELRRCRS